jgi:hypothetical protein
MKPASSLGIVLNIWSGFLDIAGAYAPHKHLFSGSQIANVRPSRSMYLQSQPRRGFWAGSPAALARLAAVSVSYNVESSRISLANSFGTGLSVNAPQDFPHLLGGLATVGGAGRAPVTFGWSTR